MLAYRRVPGIEVEGQIAKNGGLCAMSARQLIPEVGKALDGVGGDVIPAPKPGPRNMRYELTDCEWNIPAGIHDRERQGRH
ncbi:MAG: hypothetical protein ACLQJR_29150 [Stellaceae bacterium]